MNEFREQYLILISTPIYIVIIGAEMLLSYMHEKRYYTTRGTLENIYLTSLNFGLDILMRGVCLFFLNFFFQYHFVSITNPVLYWGVLLVAEDFMFYVLHYVDHYCRFFWAVHVTHHSSEEMNFTVGFRSSVFQPLYRFFYFIPLSFLGFKGIDIMFMYSATQIYGILIHTKFAGKFGVIEKLMATPSNHRVHHASNAAYLDKNMGMIFIIWDRIFGTYTPEMDIIPVKYGLTKNLEKHDPLTLVFHEWKAIWKDVKKAPDLRSKFLYVFGPPGWSHDGSTKTAKQLREEFYREFPAIK